MIIRKLQCPRCGLYDCAWMAGPYCEGDARTKALQQFAPAWRHLPWWRKWLARVRSQYIIELECENEYYRKIVKKEFDDIRLVDVNIKPDEFQMLLRSGVGGIFVSWILQAIRSIGAKAYVEVMGEHPVEGKVVLTIARMSGEAPGQCAKRYENIIRSYVTPRPVAEWHEDYGNCLFWTIDDKGNPTEPPYAGTPHDIKPFHIVDGKVEVGDRGELKGHTETGGRIHTIDSHPFPVYATHFTRIPEASMNWTPPEPPPVNMKSI